MPPTTKLNLQQQAAAIRRTILHMAHRSGGPHVGSCLSVADILTWLYFRFLNISPANIDDPGRDYLILSKGHAAMALYATLAAKGIITQEILTGYLQDNGTLPAHLDRFSAPGIEVSAGSLGHGLPMAVGLAHALKLQGQQNRVCVVMGDGESQEGSVWEAAMLAPHLELDNLIVFVDHNNLQGYGRPCELMHFAPVLAKWQAFGWQTMEINGHDFSALDTVATRADQATGPLLVCLRTVKGKGVSFMEDELKWHYFIVTDELLAQALAEIEHA